VEEAQAPGWPSNPRGRADRVPRHEQAVGETHVSQLRARLTIEPNVPVTTALFPRSSAPVTQELIVPGVLPWRRMECHRTPSPTRAGAGLVHDQARPKNAVWRSPLPAGTVQLYQADSSGRVQLIATRLNVNRAGTGPARAVGRCIRHHAERVQTTGTRSSCRPSAAACRTASASPGRVSCDDHEREDEAVNRGRTRGPSSAAEDCREQCTRGRRSCRHRVPFRVAVPAGGAPRVAASGHCVPAANACGSVRRTTTRPSYRWRETFALRQAPAPMSSTAG